MVLTSLLGESLNRLVQQALITIYCMYILQVFAVKQGEYSVPYTYVSEMAAVDGS